MNATRIMRVLSRLLAVIVLASSGGYFLVYLYRWEWNRALISGLIFVAAELAIVASLILTRLAAIERLGPAQATTEARAQATRQERTDGPTASASSSDERRYAWLEPSSMGVFIPVLMGAGAVLAAVAYVVERLAAFLVGSEKSEAKYLERLAYPATGLHTFVGPAGSGAALDPGRRRERLMHGVTVAVAVAISALAIVAGINLLADSTQSRPDGATSPAASEVTVRIGYHEGDHRSVEDTARALFEACRLTLPGDSRVTAGPEVVQGRTVTAVIEPGLGHLGIRRLRGCIEDATLDGVKAEVLGVRPV